MLVVVHTADQEVLLLERADTREVFWQSVTGKLRWDETPVQAARRELQEETGIIAAGALRDWRKSVSFEILPEWQPRYAPGVTTNLEHWFSLCLPHRCGVVLHPAEHTNYVWVDAAAAAATVWSWANRAAIEHVLSNGHSAGYS